MAWKYLVLKLFLQKQDARYDDCGSVCGQTQKPSGEFCGGCPIMKADKRFRKETHAALDEKPGAEWKEYGFDFLQTTLFAVMDLEDEPDLFVGTEILVNILKNERNKIERVERQNLLGTIRNPKPAGAAADTVREARNNAGKRRQPSD